MPKQRKSLPSVEFLRSIFLYDPLTGSLVKSTPPRGSWKKEKPRGRYASVDIEGDVYLAHRIIWKIMTGTDPDLIDHIDGDGLNNRWCNLRECDDAQNLWNRGPPKHNRSGVKGVYFEAQTQKWRASIKARGKLTYLGRFISIDDAIAARISAAERLHGNFARVA